jgi:integrase
MPKRAAGLSARKVETAKEPGFYADGNGLYLQVTASGAKSWILRFSIGGRRRDMGLGPLATMSLAKARQKAVEAKSLLKAGVDPIEARRAEKATKQVEEARIVTFRDCADAYVRSMRLGWRNVKHASQWDATLARYVFPLIGALPVDAIDTGLVLKVLEPIWAVKTETASRVRGRIESILDYARVRGHRSGENPARWRGHLDHILPDKKDVTKVEHHASLPYQEIPEFWPRLQVQDGMGARALEFAILTASRTGEVLGATWQEIDLEAGVWTIPPNRMKAGAEHRVPLSEPAVALLRKLATIRQNEFAFPGHSRGRPLSNMSMAMVLRRMKINATPHGFRSTFRTWAAERTDFAHEVAEAALAHTQLSKVVAAYQRGDFFQKRRDLMQAWAKYCSGAQ